MKFDIFLSICQTEVDGYMPNEKVMFQNFFDQLNLADQIGFSTAWVAETHLSCQVQKENPGAVIPHFNGEIGLNTDIFQLAHKAFSKTKKINIGSAIRNIICNGGPIAHAEALKTFLTIHSLDDNETRKIHLGFAAGRFPFSNTPYGFRPKNSFEESCWDVLKNKYFQEAVEIFLRLLKEPALSSKQISDRILSQKDFRSEEHWKKTQAEYSKVFGSSGEKLLLQKHWNFEKLGVIPFEAPLHFAQLTLGSHDPEAQVLANQILPVGVFNLSITPAHIIEETHQRMQKNYHHLGGPWQREYMPRTVMVFLNKDGDIAKKQSAKAWENYWIAMDGTLDPQKVEQAVSNTIAGDAPEVTDLIKNKYHPQDRLMLWFDFNNHDNVGIKESMRLFMEKVAPQLA